ncbi:unnamed protein product [Coffea canephora]|uniref:DUF7054 domain-containing protein n=2 Tax=Coffea TaxID=13442 RepID=A0A068UFK7_COFCA|nr:uncharacterized protein At4g22758-like [Coffea arabica]CDP06984.1 unnamed protein product [Coffea canephora]
MPSPAKSNHRKGTGEKNRKGKLAEKAQSFHAGSVSAGKVGQMSLLQRPRTVPDLLSGKEVVQKSSSYEEVSRPLKLTKLLLNVTIQRSLGPVQVVMSPESTVEELIAAALRQYSKEGRRPILAANEPSGFDLHYSQFSLESLNRDEKLMALGSRNFFLCPKKCGGTESDGAVTASSSSCKGQAERATPKFGLPWLKFMEFML